MSANLKKTLKVIGVILLIPILAVVILLAYGTLTDYQPPESEPAVKVSGEKNLTVEDTLTFLIWNIGYAGLGEERDFFYDGGEGVQTPSEEVEKNMKGILNYLEKNDSLDFYLWQEVDKDSKRSHNRDEVVEFQQSLPQYSHSFALNYNVKHVPVPFASPLGKTYSGLLTSSTYASTTSTRYSFPGNYSWPTSLFMLDRCFMVDRYKTQNGKELLVINTHNSAYDDGTLKQQQMDFLKNFIVEEYNKGNYVVVGGDWNQSPPNFDARRVGFTGADDYLQTNIDAEYLPQDWLWAYDSTIPTNRKLMKPFDKATTPQTLIDFFLISPNIRLLNVKGTNLDFKYSDHQPVQMTIALNK